MKLPKPSGFELVKAFAKLGFVVERRRGSHVTMGNAGRMVTIPLHAELKPGTFKAILRESGVSLTTVLEVLK